MRLRYRPPDNLPGHLIKVDGLISGYLAEQIMNDVDSFMKSFSDPRTWGAGRVKTKSALVLVRKKGQEAVVEVDLTESTRQKRTVCKVLSTSGDLASLPQFQQNVRNVLHTHAIYITLAELGCIRSIDPIMAVTIRNPGTLGLRPTSCWSGR
jgi:hypothetical protein